MAKDEKLEIQWAMFIGDARLSSQSGISKVVMRNEATRLYLGYIAGLPFLIVEDAALPHPATVPWSNVSSVGWVVPPAIESAGKKPEVLK